MKDIMTAILFDWRDGIMVTSWLFFFLAMRILAGNSKIINTVSESILKILWNFGVMNIIILFLLLDIALVNSANILNIYTSEPILSLSILSMYVFFIIYSFLSSISMINIRKKAFVYVKLYLLICPIFVIAMGFIVNYLSNNTVYDFINILANTFTWKFIAIFSWCWLIYFTRSRRINTLWKNIDKKIA